MKRITAVISAMLFLAGTCICVNAQSTTQNANFGVFYGAAAGQHVVDVTPQPKGGNYTLQGSSVYTTPVGSISIPQSFSNVTGHATDTIRLSFAPNGKDGSFSGSFTATYTNSNTYNGSLKLTINYQGTSKIPTAVAGLKYQIRSILYDPPGSSSTNGFSNMQSVGTNTSVSQNFAANDSITFSAGAAGVSNSVTFSTSQSAGSGSTYSTTYSATNGSQLRSVQQAIDHNQDQVYLEIDPTINVVQTGDTTGYYSLGGAFDAAGNFGASGPPPAIVNVNIAALKNPSLIPLSILQRQVPQPGVSLPGLSFICANPLPDNQCTQQNACGCTSADFAPIVAEDELVNVPNQSTAPSSVDAARFVYITNAQLQGPNQSGAGPVSNTFALSDANVSGTTTSNGSSYGVSYSHNFGSTGVFTLGITAAQGFTYSRSQTAGNTNGTAHVGTVTLGTSSPSCFEYVDVYEDTIYHTFAFALPQAPPPACQ